MKLTLLNFVFSMMVTSNNDWRSVFISPKIKKLTWKRYFLTPIVTLLLCHDSGSFPVFPLNSHSLGCLPRILSITLTDSSPVAQTSKKMWIQGDGALLKSHVHFYWPMWSGLPVNAKSKLRVQAGPVGPSRGVRIWASVSCWPGALATYR